MTILLLVLALAATADDRAAPPPTAEPGAPRSARPTGERPVALPDDTTWVAELSGRYEVTLFGPEGSDPAGSFEIVFGPVSGPIQDARMPHVDRVTDRRGAYVTSLAPPVTLTLPLRGPYTRHCVAPPRSTEEEERALRCPLISRLDAGLHAWFDRERPEEVDRTSPHMGDVIRLHVETGDTSGFGGRWKASFARPMGAEATTASGRFRAARVGKAAGGPARSPCR